MENLDAILLGFVLLTTMMVTVGLIRPSFAIFWGTKHSRKKVLKTWGVALVIIATLYLIFSASRKDTFKDDHSSILPKHTLHIYLT